MPRVSVIIPSYNHEKYIAEAIQSILDQTYQDFEIIITDDGSTDNTVEVIKTFQDSRIRLYCFNENQGAVAAANHCIQKAKGDFIALLNSDDVFFKNKLEKQIEILENNINVGAIFSYAQLIDENSNYIVNEEHYYNKIFIQFNRSKFEWLNYFFYNGNCLCHPSILIKKECYETLGHYDPRFAQLPDFEYWIRLCKKYEIFIIPKKLIKFRIRDNQANASADRIDTNIRMSLELSQIYRHYLSQDILNNFTKIFPELLNNTQIENYEMNPELAPFLIANLALQSEITSIKYFGIDTLYKIFDGDERIIKKIKEHCSFDFKNLIETTGKYQIFVNKHSMDLVQYSKFWKFWKFWINLKSKFELNKK